MRAGLNGLFVFVCSCLFFCFEFCLYRPFLFLPIGPISHPARGCHTRGVKDEWHCTRGCFCSRDTQISLGQFSFRNNASVCTAFCGKVRYREGL